MYFDIHQTYEKMFSSRFVTLLTITALAADKQRSFILRAFSTKSFCKPSRHCVSG